MQKDHRCSKMVLVRLELSKSKTTMEMNLSLKLTQASFFYKFPDANHLFLSRQSLGPLECQKRPLKRMRR